MSLHLSKCHIVGNLMSGSFTDRLATSGMKIKSIKYLHGHSGGES